MKKLFTLFCAALLGFSAASATVTVTLDGRQLTNGEELNYTDADLVEVVPGVLSQVAVKPVANVSEAYDCEAVTNDNDFQFCTTSCFPKQEAGDNTYKATCKLSKGDNPMDIHLDISGKAEGLKYMTVTIDPKGTPFSFTIKVDFNAGVGNVLVDKGGVYNVYNVSGVKVLTTENAEDVKALAPGLYVVNGKKFLVR